MALMPMKSQIQKEKRGHFAIRGCFDLYCTQGPNTTKRFAKIGAKNMVISR